MIINRQLKTAQKYLTENYTPKVCIHGNAGLISFPDLNKLYKKAIDVTKSTEDFKGALAAWTDDGDQAVDAVMRDILYRCRLTGIDVCRLVLSYYTFLQNGPTHEKVPFGGDHGLVDKIFEGSFPAYHILSQPCHGPEKFSQVSTLLKAAQCTVRNPPPSTPCTTQRTYTTPNSPVSPSAQQQVRIAAVAQEMSVNSAAFHAGRHCSQIPSMGSMMPYRPMQQAPPVNPMPIFGAFVHGMWTMKAPTTSRMASAVRAETMEVTLFVFLRMCDELPGIHYLIKHFWICTQVVIEREHTEFQMHNGQGCSL